MKRFELFGALAFFAALLLVGTCREAIRHGFSAREKPWAIEAFAEECALCHGLDGSGETEVGQGLYPPAPDLRDPDTQQLSDGELFSIIRNGIRFTGMPAWDHDDEDEHWKVVLFIRHVPGPDHRGARADAETLARAQV